jgi:hypothetical protein
VSFKDEILNKIKLKFEKELKEQKRFFDKPLSLKALNSAILIALEGMLSELGSQLRKSVNFDIDDPRILKNTLKSYPEINLLFTKASNELDESILSSLLIQCEILNNKTITDKNLKKKALEKFAGQNFFGEGLNKILDFIGGLVNKLEDLSEFILQYLGIALFLYYIIKLAINLLVNTRFVSTYKLKYIQKLIRMGLEMIKEISQEAIGEVKQEIKKLKSVFSGIDEFLITIAIASALYLYNRKQLQKQSTEQLAKNLCKKLKLNPFLDVEVKINTEPLNISNTPLICDTKNTKNTDNVIVPKEPFENKQETFTCEIPTEKEEQEIEIILKENLATKAIIVNEKKDKLIPLIKVNSKVTDKTLIATIGELSIYSPVNGYITAIKPNEITLHDISDSADTYLIQNVYELNQKYLETNEIKMFLKDWEVISLYPIMMANSPIIDGELTPDEVQGILYDGMLPKFEEIKNYWYDELLPSYNKRMQTITGKDNVEKNSKNETLHLIKKDIDKEEKLVNSYLKSIQIESINIAKVTFPESNEFELIEYFVELITNLNSISNPNDIIIKYRDQINEFTAKRYVIDGYNPTKIKDKGNKLIEKLEGSESDDDEFQKGLNIYNQKKKLSNVEDWLKEISKENKELEISEKDNLINQLMYLFNFYLDIETNLEKYKDLKESNNKELVVREANYISNYFRKLWIRFEKLPIEIKEIEKRIADLALFTTYSIVDIDNEEYRNYIIPSGENDCPGRSINPNLGGATETDFSDIKYWLKYCAFATLSSAVTLAWSTGFILPIGPLLLPTIYFPITPITTSYGFIVLGLTITGIWVFPMILFVNYSINYSLPIADPAEFIRKQIASLKKSISKELKNFKKATLKNYLIKIEKNIENIIPEIQVIEENIKIHRSQRPPKIKKFILEQTKWNVENIQLKEEKTTLKLKKWEEEKKYDIIYKASELGSSTGDESIDGGLSKIQQTEKFIFKQLDKLDILAEKADKIVAPLPITLQPETANFGITLKNPNPVINIETEINDNINEGPLSKITDKFKLKNEDLMKEGGSKGFAYKKYTNVLKAAMPNLIKKNPFPAYENLKITNIPYQIFLAKDFVRTGSTTYGFPGFPPFPIN